MKQSELYSSKYVGSFRNKQADRAFLIRINGNLSINAYTLTLHFSSYKYIARQCKGKWYCASSDYDKQGHRIYCNACEFDDVWAYITCVYEVFEGLATSLAVSITMDSITGFRVIWLSRPTNTLTIVPITALSVHETAKSWWMTEIVPTYEFYVL